MNLRRGDVLKARFPHASGGRGKKRPVVVVQADVYNQRLRHAVVAQVSTNLSEKSDPSTLFVDATTAEAKAAGLDRDCLVCCTLLSLMTEDRLTEKIGGLSPAMLNQLDSCLKAAWESRDSVFLRRMPDRIIKSSAGRRIQFLFITFETGAPGQKTCK